MQAKDPGRSAPPRDADDSRHVPALDGVRGLAILLVIPHNVALLTEESGWGALTGGVARAGWTGVELFFVLSGYLITRNLVEARGAPHYFRSFYVRRALRIVPLYYLVLALFLFVVPALIELPPKVLASYAYQIWFWLFLNNWAQAAGHMISWFGPCWSLAVEEQFYLVWPFVIALCAPKRLLRLCVILIGLAALSRGVLLLAHVSPDSIYRMTTSRMDALGAGAIVAILARRPDALRYGREHAGRILAAAFGALALGASVSGGYSLESVATYTVCYTSIALAAAAILLVILAQPAGRAAAVARLLSSRPLRSVGRYSYAMYLFHFPLTLLLNERVRAWLPPDGQLPPALYAVIITGLCWLLGFASYHGIERHFLRLKRYFVQQPA
jgi:peptidoglycan/LPS O-acetylase OafA/YrhL